jgi:hypothetical protein
MRISRCKNMSNFIEVSTLLCDSIIDVQDKFEEDSKIKCLENEKQKKINKRVDH